MRWVIGQDENLRLQMQVVSLGSYADFPVWVDVPLVDRDGVGVGTVSFGNFSTHITIHHDESEGGVVLCHRCRNAFLVDEVCQLDRRDYCTGCLDAEHASREGLK